MADEKESHALIQKKLEISHQIQELKAEARKLDLQLVRHGGQDLLAVAVMECW